jgi:uncharacterized membrane protein YphA (DoxX/SURF4 family)
MELLTSLNLWLWVAAGLLAFAYVMSGIMKSTRPIPALAEMMKWPADYPPGFTRFIGLVDILGGVGIVLPLATGVLAWLSPVAAICLVVLQVLAIGFHLRRGETQILPANIVLLVLAAFVAWGRAGLLGM